MQAIKTIVKLILSFFLSFFYVLYVIPASLFAKMGVGKMRAKYQLEKKPGGSYFNVRNHDYVPADFLKR